MKLSNEVTAACGMRDAAKARYAQLVKPDPRVAEWSEQVRILEAQMRTAPLEEAAEVGSRIAGLRAAISEASRRQVAQREVEEARDALHRSVFEADRAVLRQYDAEIRPHRERLGKAIEEVFAAIDDIADLRTELVDATGARIDSPLPDEASEGANRLGAVLGMAPRLAGRLTRERDERARRATTQTKAFARQRDRELEREPSGAAVEIDLRKGIGALQQSLDAEREALNTLTFRRRNGQRGPEVDREIKRSRSTIATLEGRIKQLQQARTDNEDLVRRQHRENVQAEKKAVLA